MNNNLLILCDSTYGITVKEIAESMKCFGKIDFLSSDYGKTESAEKRYVQSVGSLDSYESFISTYGYAIAVFEESPKKARMDPKISRGLLCDCFNYLSNGISFSIFADTPRKCHRTVSCDWFQYSN